MDFILILPFNKFLI